MNHLFENVIQLLQTRAKEHVRAGNVEMANKYINQLVDMLVNSVNYIDQLEKELNQ